MIWLSGPSSSRYWFAFGVFGKNEAAFPKNLIPFSKSFDWVANLAIIPWISAASAFDPSPWISADLSFCSFFKSWSQTPFAWASNWRAPSLSPWAGIYGALRNFEISGPHSTSLVLPGPSGSRTPDLERLLFYTTHKSNELPHSNQNTLFFRNSITRTSFILDRQKMIYM